MSEETNATHMQIYCVQYDNNTIGVSHTVQKTNVLTDRERERELERGESIIQYTSF